MIDWDTYLCFIVGADGRVIFSPQGPDFTGADPVEFSATRESGQAIQAALVECLGGRAKSVEVIWKAKYRDAEIREYRVVIDPFQDMALVRLYRHEVDLYSVTAQEALVLRGLMDDLADDELAEQLSCTRSTIRRHLLNLRNKLGVQGRAKLAIEALKWTPIIGPRA